MRSIWRRGIALAMTLAVSVSMTGCAKHNQDKKEKPKSTATDLASATPASSESKEAIKASGKGNNKSDIPLVVGMEAFEQKFNPFQAENESDWTAINLTQLRLITVDREGALVNHAVEGETRRYNGENYSYQGPADVKVSYQKENKETVYTIKLRKDILFSDGSPLNADDVIFSMYAFADNSYEGSETFGQLPVRGMKKYQNSQEDQIKRIAGIEKVNDYKIKVTTKGYDRDALTSLNIPICPLHFFGDEKKYNYDKGQFGFTKGGISSLIKKKNAPMGAGAYKFIKYESGIVYFEANVDYYLNCPVTVYVQLKELEKTSVAHRVEALKEGDVDIVDLEGSTESINEILAVNSNGKNNGGTISTRLYDGERYAYIGMNAKKVCVDGKSDSTRSKNLRKGLATLLGTNRSEAVELCSQSSKVINYPASDTSWSVPQSSDEEYKGAFVTDKDGQVIYSSEMSMEDRSSSACKATLEYLKLAGYKVKKGKVVAAPEGASLEFKVLVPSDKDWEKGLYTLVTNAKVLFEKIGLKLDVIDGMKQKQIDRLLKNGSQQIWCGFAETKVNGELAQMFYSDRGRDSKKNNSAGSANYFHIADSDLDEYIEETLTTTGLKKSIHLYAACYDKIMDWAVEVPVYQERDITIFSSSRINMETIVPDITTYYGWINEIHTLEMK